MFQVTNFALDAAMGSTGFPDCYSIKLNTVSLAANFFGKYFIIYLSIDLQLLSRGSVKYRVYIPTRATRNSTDSGSSSSPDCYSIKLNTVSLAANVFGNYFIIYLSIDLQLLPRGIVKYQVYIPTRATRNSTESGSRSSQQISNDFLLSPQFSQLP